MPSTHRLHLTAAAAALALAAAALIAVLLTGRATAAAPAPDALDARIKATEAGAAPGQAVPVSGRIRANATRVKLQVVRPNGQVRGPFGPFAVTNGRIEASLPAAATRGIRPGASTGYQELLALYAVPAGTTSPRQADGAPAGTLALQAAPTELVLENSFVSSVGWVKPGDAYPFTVRVKNFQAARDGGTVTIPAPDGTTFTRVSAPGASIGGDGSITWNVGTVGAARDDDSTGATRIVPGVARLIVEAKADTLQQDPQIVWKNLSATARLGGQAVASHGPKVIPQREIYDTARYGDRPFPVVPVDYAERRHAPENSANLLASKINDPAKPGSTFNLFQEMSYGQLFPNGTVPSDGIASAGWGYQGTNGEGFEFTKTVPGNTCQAPTLNDPPGKTYELKGDRIVNGWYQMPGPTGYYGSDANGSAVIGAVAGVGALQQIDAGCGPTGKAVYDAAQIADPEIDYNDFDTDKDGVVDFFMMVFAGSGGNGVSQTEGYDNIWPHSSSLEGTYVDPETGLKGYITDDRLTDLEGRLLFYTDDTYTKLGTAETAFPAYVRVGPYNVNPETAIVKASVISHEYGHSLGLPDFYSTGSRETYGTWNLMAEDRSQNMDVFSRQELGWLVPRVLEPGKTTEVKDARDSKRDTGRIDWQDPSGKPYTLTGEGVHNGEGYVAKLPSRQIIEPKKVPSGSHVYWSQAGNDFGCPPAKGHNLDIALPAIPAGAKEVKLQFKSAFQIEWDYDYGFVLGTSDGGKTYRSFPSEKGYTTATANPNGSDCQTKFSNGITGSSGVDYSNPVTLQAARTTGDYGADFPFVDDSYDITSLAGKPSTVRFTYATDPGLAKAGWFIDDLKVIADGKVLYESDFEKNRDEQIYNGGCREGLQTATICTPGWQYASAVDGSPADHAYYLEMRDRSSFDFDGRGEDDRGEGPTFGAGLSLVYTDENHGYGNVGTDDPPAQSPLDSTPTPDDATPNLDDAAFVAKDKRRSFTDGGAEGHVENYANAAEEDGLWRLKFDCLGFDVKRMAGTDTAAAGNLNGDVTFKLGNGCGRFDYGVAGTSVDPADGKPLIPGVSPAGEVKDAAGCFVPTGFRRAAVRRSGRRGLRFDVARTVTAKYTVDVFQQSRGTRITGERRVMRFTNRTGAFNWTGRGRGGRALSDGYYIVRYTVRTARGTDARRIVVRRTKGRFAVRPGYEQRPGCKLLRSAKLQRPVFGGRRRAPLVAAYRVSGDTSVTVAVMRGKRVVKRFKATAATAGRTYRVRLASRKLRRGDHKVLITAKRGNGVERTTLVSRRL